jgi:hypothetical protein
VSFGQIFDIKEMKDKKKIKRRNIGYQCGYSQKEKRKKGKKEKKKPCPLPSFLFLFGAFFVFV